MLSAEPAGVIRGACPNPTEAETEGKPFVACDPKADGAPPKPVDELELWPKPVAVLLFPN